MLWILRGAAGFKDKREAASELVALKGHAAHYRIYSRKELLFLPADGRMFGGALITRGEPSPYLLTLQFQLCVPCMWREPMFQLIAETTYVRQWTRTYRRHAFWENVLEPESLLNQEFHCALQATKNEESNSRIIPGGFPYAELPAFGCHEHATLSRPKETFWKLRAMQLRDSSPFDLPALSELLQEV